MIGLRRASRLTIWPLRKQLLGPPIPESHDGMVSFVLVLNLKDIASWPGCCAAGISPVCGVFTEGREILKAGFGLIQSQLTQ